MRLFLECKPDETLAVALGVSKRIIIHSHGKGKVSKSLSRNRDATGLVDEDFGYTEPSTFGTFPEVSAEHDVKLRLDRASGNRLVVICPKLEDWIIKSAKAANVKMDRFSLSENPGDLHADSNFRLSNFQNLIDELLEKRSPRLLHLKKLLKS